MTRATDKPLRRIVDAASLGHLVLEVTARTARLRPLGSRTGAASVEVPWGALYTHLLIAREDERRGHSRKGSR